MQSTQKQKAELFRKLHYQNNILVLPNIWDAFGAMLLESIKYKAIATASAAIAYSNGVNDGEYLTLDKLFPILEKIVTSVDLPVSIDFESGNASTLQELESNIETLIEIGVAGINIEDTNKQSHQLYTINEQVERIEVINETIKKKNTSIFINARTDVFIQTNAGTNNELLEDAIRRGTAYKKAGADCFYPIALREQQAISTIAEKLKMPINILTLKGIPSLNTLQQIGVTRVSLGPSFFKIAIKSIKDFATKIQQYEGIEDIYENDVTSDYLKHITNKLYK
ncbi:MAG: isocitrate lyase/phosphoenolpyruvate mutase family protein [Bacteroidia bacterium]|nr:isocitrate lyase/phosphoenolpyruvate mutase family protein [Bacteroidia bacterium]